MQYNDKTTNTIEIAKQLKSLAHAQPTELEQVEGCLF